MAFSSLTFWCNNEIGFETKKQNERKHKKKEAAQQEELHGPEKTAER